MKVDIFDFDLPVELIANRPVEPRDSSKLLVVGNNAMHDRNIKDIIHMFNEGDVLVLNNTKVIPARLFGKRDAVKVEILLCKNIDENVWQVMARPGKRLKVSQTVVFGEDFSCEILEKKESGEVFVRFDKSGEEFFEKLKKHGKTPLPPYISRSADDKDLEDYQTVYAKEKGAVAAPTAGLHFSSELLESLKNKGVLIKYITLHVGAGTFLPVKVEDTENHVMHSEFGIISHEVAEEINKAKENGGKVVAVGTTSLRLLESAANENGELNPFSGETDIFITPGYKFKIVDGLVTNFHLPKSTLFMLVCSFLDIDRMKAAYEHAKQKKYRFYSYGDACYLQNVNFL